MSAARLEDLLAQLSEARQLQWGAIEVLNKAARAYEAAGQRVRELTSTMEKLSERVMESVSEITKPDGEQPPASMMTVDRAARAVADAADVERRARMGTHAQVAAAQIETSRHPFEEARAARHEAAKLGLAQALLRGDTK